MAKQRGEIEAEVSRDRNQVLVHGVDFDLVHEICDKWQFFRNRRPRTDRRLTDLN